MKRYIQWLMLAAILLSGCTREDHFHDAALDEESSAVISVTTKNMLPVNMNTKAAGNIDQLMAKVTDLNIRIHKRSGSPVDFYCTGDVLYVNGQPAVDAYYLDNHHLVGFGVDSYVKIHCGPLSSGEIAYVEAIANYGSDLHGTQDWRTVKESGDAGLTALDGPVCMMYGKTDRAVEVNHPDPNTGQSVKCRNYDVSLKRSRAMITVKMQDGGLKPGITITPRKMRLHNVPVECVLADLRPDVSASHPGINRIESLDKSAAVAQEYVFELPKSISGDIAGEESPTGNHADHQSGTIPADFLPLYMFENMQGEFANATNRDQDKNPGGFTVQELKDRNNVYKYSYIEIEADYEQKVNDANGNAYIKIAGPIIYRFFLGENATTNFDVEGNHYYKLTLNLKGFGGAREDGKTQGEGADEQLVVNTDDLSWRVDMDTRDWGFEKDQYDFDSHLYRGTAKVVGNNWVITNVIGGDEGASSWLTFNTKNPYGGYMYANPTAAMTAELNIVDGKLNFWVQPMLYGQGSIDPAGYFTEETYLQDKCYREFIITVKNTDNNKEQKVTVRQYCPIPISKGNETVFIERFEEYDPKSIGFPWKWVDNDLSRVEARDQYYPENDIQYDVSYVPPIVTRSFLYADQITYSKRVITENTRYLSAVFQGYKYWVGGVNGYNESEARIVANAAGDGSAADMCYRKSHDGERAGNVQGFWAWYYALPDGAWMQEIMKYRHVRADGTPLPGPFEPLHAREDYWVLDVLSTDPLQSGFYSGTTGKTEYTKQSSERNLYKRVRSIYTNTGQFNQGMH